MKSKLMESALYKKKSIAVLFKDRIINLLSKFEVDRPVFFGILSRGWSIIAGPLTALLITLRFSPEYQGYYYTFSSLLALQIFVELGLGTVIIQFASHEWSKLRLDKDRGITGDSAALSRLISLAHITSRWYLVGGCIIAFGLGLGGYVFFSHSAISSVDWPLPWFTLCFLTGIIVCFIPLWSILEGCNQVASVYTYRFLQGIVSSLTVWIAILAGARLWAASLSVASIIICSVIFFKYRYSGFIKTLLFTKPSACRIDWRKEILPMQWRIALSWISGYFVFSLFTPILFRYHGPVIAGQFGMTWSVIGAIAGIAAAWLSPRVPQFGILIARKDYKKLDELFWRTTRIFTVITAGVSVMVWFLVFMLYQAGHPFSSRILSPLPVAVFLAAQGISTLTLPLSAYLRAHKREPLLWISLTFGIVTGFCTVVLGRRYGVEGMSWSFLAVNLLVFPFVVLTWQRCRRLWHKDNLEQLELSLRNEYFIRRLKEKGILYCVGKAAQQIIYKVFCQAAGIVCYPICRLFNVRFIYLSERAIGHLCIEIDGYLKEGILGMRPQYNTILLAHPGKVSNAHLLGYWEKYLRIIRSAWLCSLLEPLARNQLTGYATYRFAFSEGAAYFPEIQKKFASRPPLLKLSETDRKRGQAFLEEQGMPQGAWFVCLHCREDGYLGQVNQSLRNADINNYLLAVEAIVKRGGWVVRMGDATMKPLPYQEHVIDYAHSKNKSQQLDVFLCASCKFFLGSDSGLYHVASIFGVSAAIANYAHLCGSLPYGADDIGIPKLIWSEKEKRYLRFKEVLQSPLGHFLFDHLFVRAGASPHENTPADIRELALEMLDKKDGLLTYGKEDELLQSRFKALMNPTHYSYGSLSRIGRDFLRKYAFLLNDDAD
ncbi:MAG: TIGR04372 family glycosyltransferase [Candidatus Omnitrophota bacterium]|jgi:putative glycosyltransferase (TIGR04372 family)